MSVRRRLVLVGMPCRFSRAVFGGLGASVAHDVDVVGTVAAATLSVPEMEPARVLGAGTLAGNAPGFVLHDRHDLNGREFRRWLTERRADLVITACLPWRVRFAVRSIPAEGWLNVHPSLLPAYRGPEPVFRAVQDGVAETGVTLHLMDDGFDTGPVVAQQAVPVAAPDGDIEIGALETRLAATAVTLLADALTGESLGTRPQPATGASIAPPVTAADLVVATDRPAAEAARWIRVVVDDHGPMTIRDHRSGRILATVSTRHDVSAGRFPDSGGSDDMLAIPFRDGTVTVRLRSTGHPLHIVPAAERTP